MTLPDRRHRGASVLRPGQIFDVARDAGLALRGSGAKRLLRCPFHDDRHASAFVSEKNVFYCSVCTPDRGLSLRAFTDGLRSGRTSKPFAHGHRRSFAPSTDESPADAGSVSFTPELAEAVWGLARSRANRSPAPREDAAAWAYVESRHLTAAVRAELAGILADDPRLPSAVVAWPRRGYRLVAPLFDLSGHVVNVQARAIGDLAPKTLFPNGSAARGAVFANHAGQALLRGEPAKDRLIVFGEGLTNRWPSAKRTPHPCSQAQVSDWRTAASGNGHAVTTS